MTIRCKFYKKSKESAMSSIPSVSYQGANPNLNLIQQKAVSKPDEVKNESQQAAFQGAESSKKMSKGAKIALAGLGALGTIGLAIYVIKKGKAPKDIVKELSIDDFRQAGNKLVKGKAYKPDGSAFSGVFTSMKKDGSKVVMTYENGILKSSEILKPLKGKFIPSSKKVYEHGADGKISKISKKIGGHVNTPDPNIHGFQWIDDRVVDMDKARFMARDKVDKIRSLDAKIKEFISLDDTITQVVKDSDGRILFKTSEGVVKYDYGEVMGYNGPSMMFRELDKEGNVIRDMNKFKILKKYDKKGNLTACSRVAEKLEPSCHQNYGTGGFQVRHSCNYNLNNMDGEMVGYKTNSLVLYDLQDERCLADLIIGRVRDDRRITLDLLEQEGEPSLVYELGSGVAQIFGNGKKVATYDRKTKQINLIDGCTETKETVEAWVKDLLETADTYRNQWKYMQEKGNAEIMNFSKLDRIARSISCDDLKKYLNNL